MPKSQKNKNTKKIKEKVKKEIKKELQRAQTAMSGRGIYGYGRGKFSIGRAIGRSLGTAIGKTIGQPKVGGMLGGSLGNAAETYLSGRGAYVTNSLVNGAPPQASIPVFGKGDREADISFSHVEYVCDIFSTGSAAFSLQSFQINPGLLGCYPWMSQLAVNYDEYSFVQLAYTFKPLISESNQTGSMGSVIMATIYNPASNAFTTKQAMVEYAGAVNARPCDTIVHGVESNPALQGGSEFLYVRSGSVPTGEDI